MGTEDEGYQCRAWNSESRQKEKLERMRSDLYKIRVLPRSVAALQSRTSASITMEIYKNLYVNREAHGQLALWYVVHASAQINTSARYVTDILNTKSRP